MAPSGKVVKVRPACMGYEKIGGSDTHDGKIDHTCQIPEERIIACLDDLLVMDQPLPMGLRCQASLCSLSEDIKTFMA